MYSYDSYKDSLKFKSKSISHKSKGFLDHVCQYLIQEVSEGNALANLLNQILTHMVKKTLRLVTY